MSSKTSTRSSLVERFVDIEEVESSILSECTKTPKNSTIKMKPEAINHLRRVLNPWLLTTLVLLANGCGPREIVLPVAAEATVAAKMSATTVAARANHLESTFVEKGPFTKEIFNEIKPSIFSVQYPLSPEATNYTLSSGTVIDVGLPDYIFVLTSTHKHLKVLPELMYLYSTEGFSREKSTLLIPVAYKVNDSLDETLFVARRGQGRFTDRIGPGLPYQDNVPLDKIDAVGAFGYPGRNGFQIPGGTSVMFAQVYTGSLESTFYPQIYRINKEESEIAPFSQGISGASLTAIINGEPTVVGVDWGIEENPNNSSGFTYQNDVSSLSLKSMINELTQQLKH